MKTIRMPPKIKLDRIAEEEHARNMCMPQPHSLTALNAASQRIIMITREE